MYMYIIIKRAEKGESKEMCEIVPGLMGHLLLYCKRLVIHGWQKLKVGICSMH